MTDHSNNHLSTLKSILKLLKDNPNISSIEFNGIKLTQYQAIQPVKADPEFTKNQPKTEKYHGHPFDGAFKKWEEELNAEIQ